MSKGAGVRGKKPNPYKPGVYVKHILRWLREATSEEWQEGFHWYAKAHERVREFALESNLTLKQAAGVVAALSPAVRWERNIREAQTVLRTGKGSGAYPRNVEKALDILNGADPEKTLKGAKVRAFYSLLLSGGQTPEVAIDSIAILAATGIDPNPLVTNEDAAPVFNRPRQLRAIREAYERAARGVGVSPSQAQAIVWTVWRNERDKPTNRA